MLYMYQGASLPCLDWLLYMIHCINNVSFLKFAKF